MVDAASTIGELIEADDVLMEPNFSFPGVVDPLRGLQRPGRNSWIFINVRKKTTISNGALYFKLFKELKTWGSEKRAEALGKS